MHYTGWGAEWDEWVKPSDKRIAELNSHTARAKCWIYYTDKHVWWPGKVRWPVVYSLPRLQRGPACCSNVRGEVC